MSASSSSASRGSAGSAPSSFHSRGRSRRVQCNCESGAGIFSTYKPGPNFRRRFYGCENWNNQDPTRPSCKFFLWFNPICEHSEMLQQERDALEQELDLVHQEYAGLKDDFFAIAQERDKLKEVRDSLTRELQLLSTSTTLELNRKRNEIGALKGRLDFMNMIALSFLVFVTLLGIKYLWY